MDFHCIGVGTEQYQSGRVRDQGIGKYKGELSFSISSKLGSLVSAAANYYHYQSNYCQYDRHAHHPHKSRASTEHGIRIHAPTLTCWKLLTVLPMLWTISGSCLGPNMSAATPAMTASSGTPSPKRHLHPSAPPPAPPPAPGPRGYRRGHCREPASADET